jgi:AraC family transcriptional regulator, regulatory protein of adaptative response / DNA-3-methyladenine glycosylase II
VKAPSVGALSLDRGACTRIFDARDPRFDGLVFVGITTTGVYCRPICPSRRASDRHRRFFDSAAEAEAAGFRPCLRCRPELAPGRAVCDAMSRLAALAARRITAGALNGRRVADLARDLGVSERHLRRALRREFGVSPVELAQSHRMLLARHLLTDTELSMTRVAYGSGFQSLSRFNATFRDRYGSAPSSLREGRGRERRRPACPEAPSTDDFVTLALAYRPPLAWNELLDVLRRSAVPGVEVVDGGRYGRAVSIAGRTGIVFVEVDLSAGSRSGKPSTCHLRVDISMTLIPVLMPLLARLRQLFDLDAQPGLVDECLRRGGLADAVRRRPGLRVPGCFDAFETVMSTLLRDSAWTSSPVEGRVVSALGEHVAGSPEHPCRVAPTARSVCDASIPGLVDLGVPERRARTLVALAAEVARGALDLAAGGDPVLTRRRLIAIDGVSEEQADVIVLRALQWPDVWAFPEPAPTPDTERWSPWRAYAGLHVWLDALGAPPRRVASAGGSQDERCR